MGLGATLLLILSLLVFMFGLKVAIAGIGAKRRASFALLMLDMLLFCLGRFSDIVLETGKVGTLAACAAMFFPTTLCFTLFNLLNFGSYYQRRNILGSGIIGGLLFCLLSFTPLGRHNALFVIAWIIGSCLLAWNLYLLKQHTDLNNNSAEGLSFFYGSGAVIAALAVLLLCLPVGDALTCMATVAFAIYSDILYYGVERSTKIEVRRGLASGAIVIVLALIISLIYALFMVWGGVTFGNWFFYGLLASVVTVLIFEHIRPWIEENLATWVNPRLVQLNALRERLTTKLANANNYAEILENIIAELTENSLARKVVVYSQEDRRNFVYGYGDKNNYPMRIDDTTSSVLINALVESQKPIVRSAVIKKINFLALHVADDHRADQNLQELKSVQASLDDMDVDVIIPILTDDSLQGLIVIKNGGYHYSHDEVQLLQDVGQLCGVATEHQRTLAGAKWQFAAQVLADYHLLNSNYKDSSLNPDDCDLNTIVKDVIKGDISLNLQYGLNDTVFNNVELHNLLELLVNKVPNQLPGVLKEVTTAYVNDSNQLQFVYKIEVGQEMSESHLLIMLAPALPAVIEAGGRLFYEKSPSKVVLTLTLAHK